MPWLEMWLPPAAGEGAAAGLFLDGGDAAAHGAFLAAMPGCSVSFGACRRRRGRGIPQGFLSLTMSVKGGRGLVRGPVGLLTGAEEKGGAEEAESLVAGRSAAAEVVEAAEGKVAVLQEKEKGARAGAGAMNTTKHLWAGAVAAMVSRTVVAPLERLKLEYIVRGEQRNLFELIHVIATTQGLKGFWKGNFVNILRTAPFKAVNFYAYDTYRKQLHKWSGNEETTNFERFIAGAFAGVTATILCIPMDTIRTRMVAPGGEAFGGVIGVARHMIQTEGFFSLYKGLVPSLISMAPSGAVFYGVYDIMKMSYLHSPEGKRRASMMKQQSQEANALDQLELGSVRTLLYGAIAGCCAEAATYPFEVVRRQLQMQVKATRMNAFATCLKIVDQGGVPALYAGLIPSLLQVLPSASISYFVYELMKIVLKVE
ncbi:probable mitochondrial adenine nucleotide transporter BTL3 [Phragmites australis]|uniref:probable mitochondrial adenine nucleotide transporter BTL3 n=1 Tax=Phragmites australis TaxID=29695 RepID=UPI002D784860|nr:probable mitochondrial adenine nucleotide transporter BTL3 [Phragmites australis]